MSLYHHLKTWLGKKREHSHEEETVAVPECLMIFFINNNYSSLCT